MSDYTIEQMKQWFKEDNNISLETLIDWYDKTFEENLYTTIFNEVLDKFPNEYIEQLFFDISGEEKNLYDEQFEYIKSLLVSSKELGEMNPNLNLKIIISNVMNKFGLSNDDAMKLIGEVITDLD